MLSLLQGKLGPRGRNDSWCPMSSPLDLEGSSLELAEFGEGESKHNATLYLSHLKAFLSADLVYHDAHLYLQERHLESWLARLDELEEFALKRVSTIYPGHGAPGNLSLITLTRAYLRDCAAAVETGNAAISRSLAIGRT